MSTKRNPRQFPAEGLGGQVARANLPVALSAEQQNERALILQLVGRGRFGNANRRRKSDHTTELLVEHSVGEVSRERQVLDRGPACDDTDNTVVEVGVTTGKTGHRTQPSATA